RFHDVEYTKEYKTGQQVFPMRRNTYEGDHLAGDLVDYHETRIGVTALPGDHGRRRNPEQRYGCCHGHCNRHQPGRGNHAACAPPQQYHGDRRVCPWPRSQVAHAKKSRNEPGEAGARCSFGCRCLHSNQNTLSIESCHSPRMNLLFLLEDLSTDEVCSDVRKPQSRAAGRMKIARRFNGGGGGVKKEAPPGAGGWLLMARMSDWYESLLV